MNKAKAIFSGAMILVVAGASGACWYLNENGLLGKESASQPDSYVEYADSNYADNDKYNNQYEDEKEGEPEKTTAASGADDAYETDKDEISDLLTVFANVYFSEDADYTPESRSTYELIRFAYSHIKSTQPDLIKTRQDEDSSYYYNYISAKDINSVLEKYLDVSVPAESVYTENDYAYFRYKDGEFCTPAADGLPFINTAVCTSASQSDDILTAEFEIMSSDGKYADGTARFRTEGDSLILVYYSVQN